MIQKNNKTYKYKSLNEDVGPGRVVGEPAEKGVLNNDPSGVLGTGLEGPK